MNISTQISNAVANPGDTAKQVAESHSAKWLALALAVVGIIGNHIQNQDNLKLIRAQQRFTERDRGSNYVAQVNSQIEKEQKK